MSRSIDFGFFQETKNSTREFTELLMDFLDTPEKKERRMVHIPMGRFGEAIEQAKAALFLASDDSSFVTGTDFKVDGGISSCYVVRRSLLSFFLLCGASSDIL